MRPNFLTKPLFACLKAPPPLSEEEDGKAQWFKHPELPSDEWVLFESDEVSRRAVFLHRLGFVIFL